MYWRSEHDPRVASQTSKMRGAASADLFATLPLIRVPRCSTAMAGRNRRRICSGFRA